MHLPSQVVRQPIGPWAWGDYAKEEAMSEKKFQPVVFQSAWVGNLVLVAFVAVAIGLVLFFRG
jgi:hypothetical protein